MSIFTTIAKDIQDAFRKSPILFIMFENNAKEGHPADYYLRDIISDAEQAAIYIYVFLEIKENVNNLTEFVRNIETYGINASRPFGNERFAATKVAEDKMIITDKELEGYELIVHMVKKPEEAFKVLKWTC